MQRAEGHANLLHAKAGGGAKAAADEPAPSGGGGSGGRPATRAVRPVGMVSAAALQDLQGSGHEAAADGYGVFHLLRQRLTSSWAQRLPRKCMKAQSILQLQSREPFRRALDRTKPSTAPRLPACLRRATVCWRSPGGLSSGLGVYAGRLH